MLLLVPCRRPCRTSQFFYEGETLYDKASRPWFFSWTFCIAACTIISGCLAERTALVAYPAATLVIAALVHPLLVHWIWNPQVGWMIGCGTVLGHGPEIEMLRVLGGVHLHRERCIGPVDVLFY